jgi:hypothetical protein
MFKNSFSHVSNIVFYYEQGNLIQVKRELAVTFVPALTVGALSALALPIDDARVPADGSLGNRNAVDKPRGAPIPDLVQAEPVSPPDSANIPLASGSAQGELIHKLPATFERARELTERRF